MFIFSEYNENSAQLAKTLRSQKCHIVFTNMEESSITNTDEQSRSYILKEEEICDLKTKNCTILGEIQRKFNMSFVIDGTKDSTKLIVLSYVDYELAANSLLYHEETQTWWVVAKDRVERRLNEKQLIDNTYEQTYLYLHNLSASFLYNSTYCVILSPKRKKVKRRLMPPLADQVIFSCFTL